MNFFKKKNEQELEEIETEEIVESDSEDSSSDGEDGGRVFDPYEPTKEQIKEDRKNKRKAKNSKRASKVRSGMGKAIKGIKNGYEFLVADNLYPKYNPTEVGKIGHHALFTGAGWKDMKWLMKFLFIFYPPAILSLAPMYALYGAESAYGGYMAVKPRTRVQYKNGRGLNYREEVLQRHSKARAEKKAINKDFKQEHKNAKKGISYDKENVRSSVLEEVTSGASLDLD